jgi:hypothetical protein
MPPGIVGAPTGVAIDVFPQPLAIPAPLGFQGAATYFVNLKLTPEPSAPLCFPHLS